MSTDATTVVTVDADGHVWNRATPGALPRSRVPGPRDPHGRDDQGDEVLLIDGRPLE